jgi:zinc protease
MSIRHVVVVAVALFAVSAGAQGPDRSKPPALGPAPAVKLPAIQKRQLSNGLPVWIVEMHKVPVVQINLVVLTGSAEAPTGQYGIANLTASMLEDGAGARSALEVADAVDFLGADLSSASGIDSAAVRLHTPVSRLSDALPIMADVATRPTFPKEELDRLRQQRLTGIVQSRDNPDTTAQLAFSRVLFGPAHRFGTATMGTADTIKAFTSDDLRGYYSRTYRPNNAALLVVGDIAPDKVLPLLESSFGRWKGQVATAARITLPVPPERAGRDIYLVDKPGAAQSQIRVGAVGVARSTPDFFPIQVMNTILGGSYSSKLNMNLREKHGYTYGASSAFDMRVSAGPFVATAGVQTDKTSEALKEFFNELNAILQPVTADELTRAKNYVSLRFPERFETTGDITARLEDVLVYHLADDYYSKYVQSIQAVAAADVQRVARKYIQPDRLAVVVVGDQKVIEPGIRALNLGTVKVMTLDDVYGPAPR